MLTDKYTYIYTYTYIYNYYVYVYRHVYIYVYTHTHTHIYIYINIYYTHTYIYIYIYICMYICVSIYIYIHIYICYMLAFICFRTWGLTSPSSQSISLKKLFFLFYFWTVYVCPWSDCCFRHGDTVGISEAPLQYPHPVVGRASVGARASCLSSHRTRVCSARRGCHLCVWT